MEVGQRLGFVNSYPQPTACRHAPGCAENYYPAEPWHWCYVGEETAKRITEAKVKIGEGQVSPLCPESAFALLAGKCQAKGVVNGKSYEVTGIADAPSPPAVGEACFSVTKESDSDVTEGGMPYAVYKFERVKTTGKCIESECFNLSFPATLETRQETIISPNPRCAEPMKVKLFSLGKRPVDFVGQTQGGEPDLNHPLERQYCDLVTGKCELKK